MINMHRLCFTPILFFALCAQSFSNPSELDGFTEQMRQENLVYYKGTATLTGEVKRRTDEQTLELIGDQICFFPIEKSAEVIPMKKADQRTRWFCFSNRLPAATLLRIPTQNKTQHCGYTSTATIVIRDYVINLQESDVFDTAHLLKVRSASPVTPIACDK